MISNLMARTGLASAFLIFSLTAFAQDGDPTKRSSGGALERPQGVIVEDDCAGGVILDNDNFIDGRGNVVSPNVGIFTGLSNVRITKICAAISQGLGDEASGDYDVVIFAADGGGGEPGTELLREGAANIAPVPLDFFWYGTEVDYVHTTGNLYVGIDHFGAEGNLSNTFLGHDDSAANGGRFFNAAGPVWLPEDDGIYGVRLLVEALTDIEISISESADPVTAGSGASNLTYIVTATNNGGDATGLEVAVDLNLPAGVAEVSTVESAGSWSGSFPGTWNIGSLAGAASATLTVTLTVGQSAAAGPDVIDIEASVAAVNEEDTDDTNDSAQEATTVERTIDVEVTKTCSTDVVAGSGSNNYQCTIEVLNNGPSQASNVAISDTFAAVTGVSDASLLLAPSLGSAGIAAGELTWTIATLDAGAGSSLPLVRTVSLQAAEGTPLFSNTATISATETDSDDTNDSSTADTNVRWPTATFDVSKEYASGDAGPVNVTLECSDSVGLLEYNPQAGATPTSLVVRRFDTDPAGSGTTCTVTEEVPGGYYEADRTAGCDADPTADEGAYSCTITNAVTRATFKVTKNFADGNDVDEIEVAIDCNTGLILDQDKDLSDGESVEFVVTSFTEGSLECTITEDGETGYSGEYENLTITGAPVVSDEGCFYAADEIAGNSEHECVITNTPDPVDLKVTKEWVFESSSTSDIYTGYTLTLYCDARIVDGYQFGKGAGVESPAGVPQQTCGLIKNPESAQGNGGEYPDWCKAFPGNGAGMFTAKVIPEFPDSHCYWVETGQDPVVEVDQTDCSSLTISAGSGATCTIINTVFFEGIPTLSQYGMALLALLMLGVGFVSFRRYS